MTSVTGRWGRRRCSPPLPPRRRTLRKGDVGAGKGMTCHDLKGGIGSSSRLVEIGGETFTVGVLVLTNHGCLHDLTVGGENVGKAIEQRIREDTPDEGSCIMIVGTDLPVTSRQLGRIIRRCSVGLARLGSYIGHGSGEVMVGFSTANRIPAQGDCLNFRCIHESHIDDAFRAVAEATEEAVLRSMLEAHPVTGYHRQGAPEPWRILAALNSEKSPRHFGCRGESYIIRTGITAG